MVIFLCFLLWQGENIYKSLTHVSSFYQYKYYFDSRSLYWLCSNEMHVMLCWKEIDMIDISQSIFYASVIHFLAYMQNNIENDNICV